LNYGQGHWRGLQPCAWSLWVNLVAMRLLVFGLQDKMLESWPLAHWALGADGERRGWPLVPVLLTLLIVHGAFFVWQAVGAIRAGEVHALAHGTPASAVGAQLLVVVLFLLTLAYVVAGVQTTLPAAESENVDQRRDREQATQYSLTLAMQDEELQLKGLVSPGITRRVRDLLVEHPGIDTVVLESDGGNVYEARGLARLFQENGIRTHVDVRCASACAVAFIGGQRRTLASEAKIGLHAYRMDSVQSIIVTDAQIEQGRDRSLFAKAGVAPWFVERMFDTPADGMWWPTSGQLLSAGVAHEIAR